jgi:Na+-transporting NADH:ubiquinone oxidoreductase subunit NqrA
VMAAITAAQQVALGGERARARELFGGLWARIGDHGDPLHRVTLAHFMADVQDDPSQELEWDRRALAAADVLTDDGAAEYHPTLSVRGMRASLHASLAADHERLGRLEQAREQLQLAEAAVPDLPDGGYGELVRSVITELRERLQQR